MKIADFRIQSVNPDAPSAGVVGCFANASGTLVFIDENGTTKEAGTKFSPDSLVTGAIDQALNTGAGVGISQFIGRSGTYMALPDAFLKIQASGANDFLIPIYKSI